MSYDHQTAFRDISKGDEEVYRFLFHLFAWFHILDDLIDRDKPFNIVFTITTHLTMLETVADNAFFQAHKRILLPIIQASSLAYMESERFKLRENPLDRIGSQVLKSQYQDIFFAVARIIGGVDHMVLMSQKYRDFDFDPVPKPCK